MTGDPGVGEEIRGDREGGGGGDDVLGHGWEGKNARGSGRPRGAWDEAGEGKAVSL